MEQKAAEERAREKIAKVKAGDPSRKRFDVEWREGGEERSDGSESDSPSPKRVHVRAVFRV